MGTYVICYLGWAFNFLFRVVFQSCRYILPKSQKGADAKSEGDATVKDKENDAPKEALWICQVMSGDRGDVSIL